jgi:hypothetical protein
VAGLTENKTKPSSLGLAELGNIQTQTDKQGEYRVRFPDL